MIPDRSGLGSALLSLSLHLARAREKVSPPKMGGGNFFSPIFACQAK
jgi:hypothetical protein